MLSAILGGGPATSIDDVVARMDAIDRQLPDTDGLKWFNRLYLDVTRGVRAELAGGVSFRDRAFLDRLDVIFANLYFDAAVAGDRDPMAAPSAWRPLFAARGRALAPLQFALAGMNAHINRDLPLGIVNAYIELGGAPSESDARHADFEQVNDVLERVEQTAKADLSTGAIAVIDAAAGRVDDALAMWKVRVARDAAWTNAEVLWALQGQPLLRDRYFSRLDGLTGLAGQGLLASSLDSPPRGRPPTR
jgi:hypothetical protein